MSKQLSLKKTRVDFISDLLQSKKLGTGDKERVYGLIAKEIDFMESKGDFIISEIEAIKAKLNVGNLEEVLIAEDQIKELKQPPLCKYTSPGNNAEFLKEINQDPILKSLTHNVDTNQLLSINEALGISHYDFDKHITEIRERYAILSSKYKNKLSIGLWHKISEYINGKKPWSEDKITMSWSNAELLKWSRENPGECPNPAIDVSSNVFKFSRISTKNGEQLQTMTELVLFFKRQVTIRFDNNLHSLVEGWNIPYADKLSFNLEKLKSKVEFFTDVEKLHQAYRYLIQLCIDCHPNETPKIELSVEIMMDKKIVFSIWQKNAVCKRTKDDLLNRYGATFTNLINNQINGLCDWTLDADFGDGDCARLMIWPKNAQPQPIEKMEGLRYNLIFS